MSHIFLVVCAIMIAGFWVTNAAIMLASPRLWFRLSFLAAARGVMTEQKYGNVWGYIQVRTLGAIFLAVSLGVIYDVVSH